jgi:hypothetical protein
MSGYKDYAKLYHKAVAEHKQEATRLLHVGLWKHGDRLVTSSLRKTDIPKYSRLFFIPNDYKTKGGNQPDYVGFFIPVKEGEK